MTSFQYIDFYDYPRSIVLDYRGKLILLLSAFDEELDDYPNAYAVYLLPPIVAAQLWKFLKSKVWSRWPDSARKSKIRC
jgi:hypothetical protein